MKVKQYHMKPTKLIVYWVQAWNGWGIDCEDQFGNWYGIDEFCGQIFHRKIDAISAAREWKKRNQVPEIIIGKVQKI
tara:strand:+ start:400 stop:630 length:231 start_codon:yes stop_codon:yes gene_type:complete